MCQPWPTCNLLSVAKVTEAGKTVQFGETQREFIDGHGEVVEVASTVSHYRTSS